MDNTKPAVEPVDVRDLFEQFAGAATEISECKQALDAAEQVAVDAKRAYQNALDNGQELRRQLQSAMDDAVPTSVSAGTSTARARVS